MHCPKEATHTFVWPWGTEGAVCQEHIVVVQQQARNARGPRAQVGFTPLNPDRPREITRDERIELRTLKQVAESERDDARAHAAKLFEANTQLSKDLRALRVRVAEFERQVRELTQQVDAAYKARDEALALAGAAREAAAELGAAGFDEALSLPTPPFAPPPTIVE